MKYLNMKVFNVAFCLDENLGTHWKSIIASFSYSEVVSNYYGLNFLIDLYLHCRPKRKGYQQVSKSWPSTRGRP